MKQSLRWLYIPWLLCAAYIFGFSYPAAMDLPNHLARAFVLDSCMSGSQSTMCQNFLAEFRPISYFFADYSIILLLKIFPNPFWAGKIALFLVLSLNLVGWYVLFRKVRGEMNAAYVAGLLLLFNNFFYKGFYAYLLGNGAFLFWLAYWWPRRNEHSLRSSAGLSVGLFALFLCHLGAFFSALICYGAYAVWRFVDNAEGNRWQVIRSYARDWLFALTFLGIYGFQQYATGATLLGHTGMQGLEAGSASLRWWMLKLVRFTYVTFNHHKYFDTLIFALVVLVVASAVRRHTLANRAKSFLLFCSLVFAVAYLVTPDISHGGSDVDLRFLLPGYFVMFLGFGALIEDSKSTRSLVISLVTLQFAFNFYYQFPVQSELGALDRAMQKIPAGQRLVEINSRANMPTGTLSRVNPLSHYGTYYMLKGGVLVNGMLNCYMNPNIPYFCYRNPEDSTSTFKNQFEGLPALSKEEIEELRSRFDYILLIEPSEPLVEMRLPENEFARIYRDGDVYVLKPIRSGTT
ncbi:MAG: hypothetical protein J0M12_05440 [Deltaproteobacteria bacterium]|nr:hypothetical protein [Deltaproteobacteria bacterium]